jgi:predicted dehydrogenase
MNKSNRAPLRAAILGAGGIAETHAQVLKALPGVECVAVCDMQEGKAEAFREKMQLPAAFQRLGNMLSEAKPDVVHLAVSPAAHCATALTCLEAGSHVFVEKPFCLTSEEAGRISALSARSGRVAGVNHNMVFHPTVQRAIQAVRTGRLGAIEHATIAFCVPMPELPSGPYTHWLFQNPGNIMFELGVHPLSVICRLFGRVLEAQTLCADERTLPSGVKFQASWQVSLRCERGTASLLLSLATGFHDVWFHIQGEDGVCHGDLRRDTVAFSDKSVLLGPNANLSDSWGKARQYARDGWNLYRNYLLSSLGRPVPYPLQYASMDNSIRAFYDALARSAVLPMGCPEGSLVVEACEKVIAPAIAVKGGK